MLTSSVFKRTAWCFCVLLLTHCAHNGLNEAGHRFLTGYTLPAKAPEHIALLLPLSGALAGPGHAVEDGFMAAYRAGEIQRDVFVKVYDTAVTDSALLYQEALNQGADYVIGPLTKGDVTKIVAIPHPVPTLVLNDTQSAPKQYLYSLSLSPNSEARQVAHKAYAQGLRHALIIAPSNPWGKSIAASFENKWQKLGGSITDALYYDEKTNLNQSIRSLLQVSKEAEDAYSQLNKSKPTKGQPRPKLPGREDFDMIFLVAYPSSAHQIMPLLGYYFALKAPVYATSITYPGAADRRRNQDLNGIIFCDMPFMFHNDLPNKNWPEQFNSYARLYALGMDAYLLATGLKQLSESPQTPIEGNSGDLYLSRSLQVKRILSWGSIKNGIAVQER